MSTEEKKLPQPPAGEAKQESKNRIRAMFLGLVVVMLMSSLNQTILAPSLPTIVGELHGVEHMSWVITIFILLSTITMPVYGKLSDQFGRKPFLIFAIAYIACRVLKLPYKIAAPAGMICASNFFELAVAVAIALFGTTSPAALATTVGVLTEVPVMLFLVKKRK